MLKKLFSLTAVAGVLSTGGALRAQDAEVAAEDKPAEEANKLLPVTTLEQAFARTLQKRQQLANQVVILVKALRAEEDEEKKEKIKAQLEQTNRGLQGVKLAMEVVFGLGNRREYEYIANTIYLKVGTIEQTFGRAVQTRETLKKFIEEKTKEKEEAEDAETVQELEKQITGATKQYQVVVASLQIVFNVVPQRNYTYNPKNATLYLNVTEAEGEELKTKIAEIRKKQEEATPAKKGGAE